MITVAAIPNREMAGETHKISGYHPGSGNQIFPMIEKAAVFNTMIYPRKQSSVIITAGMKAANTFPMKSSPSVAGV